MLTKCRITLNLETNFRGSFITGIESKNNPQGKNSKFIFRATSSMDSSKGACTGTGRLKNGTGGLNDFYEKKSV